MIDPNGKIDKPSLPFPAFPDANDSSRNKRGSFIEMSMTDTEKRPTTIWAEVLPERTACMIGPESNIFNEGGHSIIIQQLFFLI